MGIISDTEARDIARDWQSPGPAGNALAALASGADFDPADVLTQAIYAEKDADGADLERLRALQEYARTGIATTLEGIRTAIVAENVSYGALVTLQEYGEQGLIPAGDHQLQEWAGIPEDEAY